MPQDPFLLSPGDAEEPESSGLPAAEGTGPGDDLEGMEQGLYVCLPAEQLTLAGFAQGGEADTMTPGPLLATVVHTVTGQDGAGLAGCSDDQLVGIISAAQRMESRAAWTRMAAMREFAARRPAFRGPGGSQAEFAADELADELHLTPLSAAEQIDFACTVARRLPKTFAALAAGQIHPVHVRIIEDETRFLAPEQAAVADAALAETAPGQTFGELRAAAHKLVLTLDPDAARKRKEAARQEAHVRRFREESGNAGMVARELPSDEVLASWQHVEQRALDLRAAGMPGTLQQLRVRAYLDLLQERDSRDLPGPGGGPSVAALVTVTVPLATALGQSSTPGEVDGFGPLDTDDARDLIAAVAPAPSHALVRHRRSPRRHRRRARLRARPASSARHRTPGVPDRPVHQDDPGRARPLRPCPRRGRLPPQPHSPAPDPRPQRHVHRARLPSARGPLRPGPYRPMGPGRDHLRM